MTQENAQSTEEAVVKSKMSQEEAQGFYDALLAELHELQAAEKKDSGNAQRQRALRSRMRTLVTTYGLTHVIARGNKPPKTKEPKQPREKKARAEGDPEGTTKKAKKGGRKKVDVSALEPAEVTEELIAAIKEGLQSVGLTENESYDPDVDGTLAFAIPFINTANETWASDLLAQARAQEITPTWFAIGVNGTTQVVALGPVNIPDDEDF